MFKDESGGLGNVPSVDTLRKAFKDAPDQEDAPVKSLMDQIGQTVRGRLAEARLSQSEDETRKYILKEFAGTGKAPSERAIVEAMKPPSIESVRRLIERLHKADILTMEGGEIVSAYPFSAKPTRHKVLFPDAREIYALCATDAVGIHFMLRENVIVRSRCPECEREMTVQLKDEKAASCDPDTIIQFVSNSGHCGCTAKTFCPFMNFFCSREHLDSWRRKNPAYSEGEQYSLQQTLEWGRYIFGDFLK